MRILVGAWVPLFVAAVLVAEVQSQYIRISCGKDDFRCDNGNCIEQSKRCNRIVDCPNQEDEQDCECRLDEFRCENDGTCIEQRRVCDSRDDCSDGSDERSCACGPDQWQCDHGSCINRKYRCDGRVDCPTDRSDERNCVATGYFTCDSGEQIPAYLRCNRHYDCRQDYSDEQNCPCGVNDFKCDNGHCIPESKHCDRTHDCQDGSDERYCTYGTFCMAYEYECKSGMCVQAEARCNGTVECNDDSDEAGCTCKRGQYSCRDGSCINIALRCDGHNDCRSGEDEFNCETTQVCSPDQFSCPEGGCGIKCNGEFECNGGEDEANCATCTHQCDGKCIPDDQICDRHQDCSDASDEKGCDFCNRPDDFRCDSGECLTLDQRCNGIKECSDGGSDESNCDSILPPSNGACTTEQFQCVTSSDCIDKNFYCDGRPDCLDNSDEPDDCQCPADSWQCQTNSQCIPSSKVCDGFTDCSDSSDEYNCNFSTQRPVILPEPVPSTTANYYTTSRPSYPGSDSNNNNAGGCSAHQWRCENGPCIDVLRRCDGHIDCPLDFSDEFDCPPNSPVALNLKTYPTNEKVRYVTAGGDVVLQCRDEGPQRARVKWYKERGFIKDGSTDVRGRLEMFHVTDVDSGVYVCQAEDYANYPGSQMRVTVEVGTNPTTYRPFLGCQPHEATCGNGQCIPKSAVCNNDVDCEDGSDEENCHHSGACEPNEFKCNNGKCVLKTWICDSEDDCGDSSDEQNCGVRENGKCSPVEFTCQSQNQCIPKSFHCDMQSDCFDGSDEIGCVPVYVKSPPKPQNVKLNPGDTLILRCEAVGVPVPLISWRLNWGHVPAKCTWTSDNGIGELTCPNMQPDDSGAYSCEAMNNKGTTFATPDAIVFVNKTDLCPRGYFNNEARTASECIRCFCFGKSSQCRSADLFTYNMPTPLGEGGTRLIGIMTTPSGDVNIDAQSIFSQYYYQPLRNGATVTKIDNVPHFSNSQPYLTLPETYNGNQLKSYGGHIKYNLAPHRRNSGYDNSGAAIIIKSKYGNLFHINRSGGTTDINVEARLTPESWSKYPDGSIPAAREDIMMVLDDIEVILLRAHQNYAGVNITDFAMESAEYINVGLGAANLVEECTCPKGYEGLSCQKCASGYLRKKVGPWLGDCEPEECPPGTYGDPSSGLACRPCPCPLTNRENQFARTCSLGPDGSVICDCFQGYVGQHCEVCAPGYEGNPLLQGDSCRPIQTSRCNPIGTKSIRPPDECVCKDNVQGRYCDQCKNETFFLSNDFRHGCADCFCTGITQQCTSSEYRRKTISAQFNVPQIVNQVRVYSSTPAGRSSRYLVPKKTSLIPELQRGEVTLNNIESNSRSSVYYWSLPISFAGDKVTSYGGYLSYVLKNVPSSMDSRYRNTAADVHLISDNQLIFHYFGDFDVSHDGIVNASINLLEKGWQRPDGNEVTRAQFLLALADVKTILVKATYSSGPSLATPVSASIEIAEPDGYGPVASQVEQCSCPQGYKGTSCEDCMPGYTRSKDLSGLYLGQCDPCQCNGKSNMCHPETGACYECADNTAGDKCELCKPGFERDSSGRCRNLQTCSCDPRGSIGPCNSYGKCECKRNVEGDSCNRCRPGTFGLDENNPDGCLPCYCSGVSTDCHEGSHYTRVDIAAPILGEDYGGYTITDLNAEKVIKDNFIPVFDQSELMYNFQFSPTEDYYWSLPIFPGNRVLSYGGSISLRQQFVSDLDQTSEPGNDVVLDGGDIKIFWSNPRQYPSRTSYSYQVPLKEEGWYILNTATPATHSDFMSVLRNLKRVLVRATVARNTYETAIADVSMDTAAETYDTNLPVAKGIEICMNCPAGYLGTSCETCDSGYYKDERGYCRKCSCNGHDCQLDSYGQLVCNCRPPYTGYNCGIIGLVMELHPTIQETPVVDNEPLLRKVTFTCKYRGPEPLTIKFYHEGQEQKPSKYYNESRMEKDGWHGEHVWHTLWDTRRQGEIYECHTITEKGFTLGVLTTSLPEPGDSTVTEPTTQPPPVRPSPPESTVIVTIDSPTIQILEVGSSVSFTCTAQSRITRARLPINWSKQNGNLPLERTYTTELGTLQIINLQVSDSGVYICETNDGINTAQAKTTLKVPGNEMTQPRVEISPSVKEYYEGDVVELECKVTGNPTPTVWWQRGSNRPLPFSAVNRDNWLTIDSASVEDGGEYRCIASNAVGTDNRIAMITIRPRPFVLPSPDKLTVSNTSPNVDEGQSIRIVCTGSTNVPPGSIDWVRQDNTAFTSNVRSENGVLNVDYATSENQGVYICRSPASNVAPVPILLTVIVKNPVPDVYKISTSVDSLKIPTDGSGTVDCSVTGRPAAVIKWTKSDGNFGAGTSQRGNTLIINNAQESDQGYYLCTGTVDDIPVVYSYVFVEIERREAPKVIIWPEGEQAVPLGGQHELHCRVISGIPEPDVTWDRNGGRSLLPSTHLQKQNVLKFNKIEVNDEGEYTCTARNVAGSASASAVIKVRSPPEIIIVPTVNENHFEISNGDPLNVECRATGYPEPVVSITFNGYEIVPPQLSHANLRVPSASYRDNGYYTCVATSAAGTTNIQFAVSVERGDGAYDGDPRLPDYEGSGDNSIDPYNPDNSQTGNNEVPSNLYAIEGQPETVIYCNYSGNGRVSWTRADNLPFDRNIRQSDSRLIISNVSKRDSAEYVCNIFNEYGEVQHAVYTSLVVVAAPRITLRPPEQTVQPGQSPTVECIAEGDDIFDVTWRPYNKYPSERMEIRNNMLIFNHIEVEDAGQYECIARSPHANTTAIAKVVVNEDSDRSWTSHDNVQWAHAGAAVHLQCNVTQPNTNVIWTKDARPLPRSIIQKKDGSLFIRLAQKSDTGRYVCSIQDQYGRTITTNYIELHIQGPRVPEPEQLVYIEPPSRAFRVGDNVNVQCKNRPGDIKVQWIRPGTTEYVVSRPFGGGAILTIQGVTYADAGVYRCVGRDLRLNRESYDEFELKVESGPGNPGYPDRDNIRVAEYTARLRQSIDLPCQHNLDPPVNIEWRREFVPQSAELRTNQPNLHLKFVTEADAGTYVCRVSNNYVTAEARAILKVNGVVPMFTGESYITLPPLKDAPIQLDIEISFKPTDDNGLILYNSEDMSLNGDYIALQLKDGVPEFILNTGNRPITKVSSDRPLQLNTWHTIRLSRTATKVTMDVDNTGPFTAESSDWAVLDLGNLPIYIGGVPNYDQLPNDLAGASGFIGCVSMLILGRKEINIMLDSIERYQIQDCNSCTPNLCQNNGICQEAQNERGYSCICAAGYAGLDCDRTGAACRPGLCGPGKCTDTAVGYKCACPVTHTGTNCETKQSIEYPAFTGSTFLAIQQPKSTRTLKLSMNIKAAAPVSDGIIMYCAESPRGYGGYTSLAVHNGRLEFRFELGSGSPPVLLVSNKTLPDNAWIKVQISRIGSLVSLKIDSAPAYEQSLPSPYNQQYSYMETPIFVGGVDDYITLNKNVGVTEGFNGCIKDIVLNGDPIDIMNQVINSANVHECVTYVRGDIPEDEKLVQCQCQNGGRCISETEPTICSCSPGFTGQLCQDRAPSSMRERTPFNPCGTNPCQNGGTCRSDYSSRMNYTCDCPLGHAGASCQMQLPLYHSVGFNGNGYIELPASLLRYNLNMEATVIAMALFTTHDGVLLYQAEGLPNYGDYILLRIERGVVVLEWDAGSGKSVITINEEIVTDGERHGIIAKLMEDGGASLSVDGHQKIGSSKGIASIMNVDSNIYIGGIPENMNPHGYPGFTGCIDQVELMNMNHGLNLGQIAAAGRNAQRCKNSMFPDVYPYFEEVDVFESPPPGYFFNNNPQLTTNILITLLPSFICFLYFRILNIYDNH